MNAVEFDGLVKELEVRLDQLKALYDQYFQGMERLPPTKKRESIERVLKELRRDQPRNTAARFRFQTLWQRWVTMTTHWDRICRQIEEGTYKRDVLRAQRRRQRRAEPDRKAAPEIDVEVDLDDFDFDAEVGAALEGLRDDKTDPEIAIPRSAPSSPSVRAMPEAPRAMPAAPAGPRLPFATPAQPTSGFATFSRPKEASFKRPPAESRPPQVGAPRMATDRPAPASVAAPRHGAERTSMAPAPSARPAAPARLTLRPTSASAIFVASTRNTSRPAAARCPTRSSPSRSRRWSPSSRRSTAAKPSTSRSSSKTGASVSSP
ncbi:MAG: hypothetical protein H6720_05465 [Sandaracinus sp.]|nr:hypothetical protein [Sandaracinus sp.]